MSLVRVVARPLLAAPFVLGGIDRLRSPQRTASSVRGLLQRVGRQVPQARQLADHSELIARVTGGVQVAAGALLAAGRTPRAASTLIVLSQVASFAADSQSNNGASKPASIATQLGLTGGALLASVDTAGQPSLAWRAKDGTQRGAKAIRREARAATKAAKKALS